MCDLVKKYEIRLSRWAYGIKRLLDEKGLGLQP